MGTVTKEDGFGWYRSEARPLPVLGGATCRVVVDGYDDDPHKDDFHAAIGTFLALDESVLRSATPYVFEYYQDVTAAVIADDDLDWYVEIPGPDEVWNHIEIGYEVMVQRHGRSGLVYMSVACGCDWEPEHGLQIVFREGRTVSKVGPYDGHLTNASAYDRDDLADVIYHRLG